MNVSYTFRLLVRLTWNIAFFLVKVYSLDYENKFVHSVVNENDDVEIAYNHMTSHVLLLSFLEVSFCFLQQTPQLTHDQEELDHPCDISHLQHQLDPQIEQTQNPLAPL